MGLHKKKSAPNTNEGEEKKNTVIPRSRVKVQKGEG